MIKIVTVGYFANSVIYMLQTALSYKVITT
jgi:hypothetical protein